VIVAIDTSAAQCAVAVCAADATVLAHSAVPMARGHAEHLFPMLDDALRRAGGSYADLTRVAVCTGPGSFTGIRVGVSAARGLALGRGVPVFGVTRFEALAAGVAGDIPVAVAIAARGGRYRQDFRPDGTATGEMRFEAEGETAPPPVGSRPVGDGWCPDIPGGDGLADPAAIARLAATRAPGALPVPVYLRVADADPPREAPPRVIDA